MNQLLDRKKRNIKGMIYEIRGKEVILDSDLAKLYGVETKRINEAVKNNLEKFPERFSWKLSDGEYSDLRSKISTSSENNYGGRRYNPRVFTEQGIAMLATVLKSKVATEVSISIMDAFVAMRHYIIENKDIYKSLNIINNKLLEHDEKLNLLFSKFNVKEKTFLPGKTYDAYREIINIFNEAKEDLIIIDSYADINLLDVIGNIQCQIILITSNKAKLSDVEINKFNRQYNKLTVIKNNTFHDRYFILDRKMVYHCGTSLNYAGTKVFSINLLEDDIIKCKFLDYVSTVLKNKWRCNFVDVTYQNRLWMHYL